MIDAVLSFVPEEPAFVSANKSGHASVDIEYPSGLLVQINALGEFHRCFHFSVWGVKGRRTCEIRDNFGMFKRGLGRFIGILNGKPHIEDALMTMKSIKLLAMGREALATGRKLPYS